MGTYAQSIFNGAFLSIFLITLLTIPFLIYSYRKYDGVYLRNSFVVATFVLYLCCAYALIVFPLPTFEEARNLQTELYSFRPFRFVQTFLQLSPFDAHNRDTWLLAMRHHSFIEPFFNFLLLMPLGIYLTGFFKKKLRVAVLIAFCVSLFFEITQLTGLYGIYPRPYRLFDVDDLITNTSGAVVGACIGLAVAKLAPFVYARKPVVSKDGYCSMLRRLLAFLVDWVIIFCLEIAVRLVLGAPLSLDAGEPVIKHILVYAAEGAFMFAYFWLFSVLLKGQTPGKKLLKMRVVAASGGPATKGSMAAHYGIAVGLLTGYSLLALLAVLPVFQPVVQIFVLLGWLLLGGVILLLTQFTRKNKRFWYERLSHTVCVSSFAHVQPEEEKVA